MIGRADIEGSKSSVAMSGLAATSQLSLSKGSIGHAFTVRIRTENQNQASFYPFVPHEISVLVELILGHLRYLLTDVPPQPNSPPDNVLRRIDREASLGSKRRGCYPPPIHGCDRAWRLSVLRFSRARECTDTTRRAVLFQPLDPTSAEPFQGGQAVSAQLGTVTRLRFIPHRQITLTKNGPLGALDSVGWLNKAATRPTYLKFENRSRALRPDASNHWLYPIELRFELRLSEETGGTSY
ncbi:hypothetical protein Bca101_101487 [Brassica carinata]